MNENSFKLLIENALLEQEKRITKEYRAEMIIQTDRFASLVEVHNGNLQTMSTSLVKLEIKVDQLKVRIWAVGVACSTLGGFVGFFISKLI